MTPRDRRADGTERPARRGIPAGAGAGRRRGGRGLTYRGVPSWDSLGHMALVAAIEDEFGVELDSDQVLDMASFSIALTMLGDLGVDG